MTWLYGYTAIAIRAKKAPYPGNFILVRKEARKLVNAVLNVVSSLSMNWIYRSIIKPLLILLVWWKQDVKSWIVTWYVVYAKKYVHQAKKYVHQRCPPFPLMLISLIQGELTTHILQVEFISTKVIMFQFPEPPWLIWLNISHECAGVYDNHNKTKHSATKA